MKTSKILFAFAVVCLVTVGCPRGENPNPSSATVTANLSGCATYPDGSTQDFKWNSESTLSVLTPEKNLKYTVESGAGTKSGKFNGEDAGGVIKFVSSPYSEGSFVDEDGNVNFFFPNVQTASVAVNSTEVVTPDDVKVMVSGRTANGTNVDLENVAAFFRIPIRSEAGCRIDSVEIATAGIGISGKAILTWDESGKPSAVSTSEGNSYSRVAMSQTVLAGQDPIFVTVPVIPATLPDGYRITVYTKTNNVKLCSDPITIEAGQVVTTDLIKCGDSYAILTDGPSFNTIIKEMANKMAHIEEPDTSDFFVSSIRFNVNSEMPENTDEFSDVSAYKDGSILAGINEDGDVEVYTESASIALLNGSNMFHRFANLQNIYGIENLDTYGATAMKHMFSGAKSLTRLDLSSFQNVNATGLDSMFWRCYGLRELILGDHFVTSSVMRTTAMFHSCTNLQSVDVSKFDISGCSSISMMFQNCWSMEEIVFPLDASSCTTITQLFYNCCNTKHIDISKMKTSEKLVNTRYLFYKCNDLEGTLDLRNLYTLKDSSFYYAFAGMGKIDSILVGENFQITTALTRSQKYSSALKYFFGANAPATNTTCYVGAAHDSENPTVIVCSRLFLQQVMAAAETAPRIQMKSGKVKFINEKGNKFTLKTSTGEEIAITDINTGITSYIVVDPDEKKE